MQRLVDVFFFSFFGGGEDLISTVKKRSQHEWIEMENSRRIEIIWRQEYCGCCVAVVLFLDEVR